MKKSIKIFLNSIKHDNLCLVIGLNHNTGLSTIRELGYHKIKIIGMDENQHAVGRYSKFCDVYFNFTDKAHLLELLVNIGILLKEKVPIFVSTDKLVILIEQAKDILSKYYLFYWQNKNRLIDIINKNHMLQMAIEAGLDVPKTFSSLKYSLRDIKNEIEYPAVVKPSYTSFETKALLVRSDYELTAAIINPIFSDGYVVSQLILGPVTDIFTVGSYSRMNGDVVAIAYGNKKRTLPNKFGISTYIVSSQINSIYKLTEKFLKHIEYFGIADLEFKKCPLTGKFMFIEINPRPCTLNQLYMKSGTHLNYICFSDLKKNLDCSKKHPLKYYKVRHIDIFADFVTVFRHYKQTSFMQWIKDVFKANSYEVLSSKDPLPFIVYFFGRAFGFFIKKIRTLK